METGLLLLPLVALARVNVVVSARAPDMTHNANAPRSDATRRDVRTLDNLLANLRDTMVIS
ncbi:MAG: hypothetical protein ACYC9L_03300 [Sulfuricaulis sp.]